MKEINGDVRMYVIINTTDYNDDGKYGVTICNFTELFQLGFDAEDDWKQINDMNVNDLIVTNYKGCFLMRIA